MTPVSRTSIDERPSIEQGGPPAEPPPATPQAPSADMVEAHGKAEPPAQPAAPPTPPGSGTVARQPRNPSGGRWALALGLAFLGGLTWFIFGWGIVFATFQGPDIAAILVGAVSALLPAVTCLVAGWLLRSWRGMVATSVVYVVAAALLWALAIAGVGDLQVWLVAFPLYVVLPGMAMAAIGTVIGMRRTEQGGHSPREIAG